VINVSSASSLYGIPEFASYSASKFAVKGFTEALELEWQAHGIRVCDVIPPFVATNMLATQKQSSKIMNALGVDLSADDVADTIFKQINSPKTHAPSAQSFQHCIIVAPSPPFSFTAVYSTLQSIDPTSS